MDLTSRRDEPIPDSYKMAATLASVVVLVCFATARWAPVFAYDLTWHLGPTYRFAGLLSMLASVVAGLTLATIPWIAFRWPVLAIALALLPFLPSVIGRDSVHFGVYASLCTIVVTAGWRTPRAALAAAVAALLVIWWWLFGVTVMAIPFSAFTYANGGRPALGLIYTVATGLVVLGSWALRTSAEREQQRRGLVARAGEVEEHSAVLAERSRLARDLHDVVAHHVSLIAVRAETAPYTNPGLAVDARAVLADIAADARLALDELRGVLGILGRAGAERAPQPTWSDITALVERTRSAGTVVMLSGDTGDRGGDPSPTTGYVAYRVVQEALTNARKHAAGRPVTVELTSTAGLAAVRVSTPLRGEVPYDGQGHGLVGMRERVEAIGGTLNAGPVGDVFVVEAHLPRVVG